MMNAPATFWIEVVARLLRDPRGARITGYEAKELIRLRYQRLATAGIVRRSASRIACCGQADLQIPHPQHFSAGIVTTPRFAEMALKGHRFAHRAHPVHLSASSTATSSPRHMTLMS
jgi:hypothetical protein